MFIHAQVPVLVLLIFASKRGPRHLILFDLTITDHAYLFKIVLIFFLSDISAWYDIAICLSVERAS